MTRIFNPSKSGIFNRKELVVLGVVLVIILIMIVITVITIRVSRNDAQVTQDATTVLSSMQQFAGDHSGVFPAPEVVSITQFKASYKLPDGYTYSYGTSSDKQENMAISNRNCNGQAGASVHFYLPSSGQRCIETL